MKSTLKVGAFAAALLGGASSFALSAAAADPVPQMDLPVIEAPAVTFGWTGFHIGVTGGYGTAMHTPGFQVYEYTDAPLDGYLTDTDVYSFGANIDYGGKGPLGAIDGGFDVQLGNHFVIGILGDYTWSRIRTEGHIFGDVCYELATPDDCDTGTVSDSPEASLVFAVGNSWTVAARAGILANPRTLIYGLVGFTRTQVALTGSETSDPTGPLSETMQWTVNSPTFGVGVETLLTPNISARLEYRISPFGFAYEQGDDTYGFRVYEHSSVQTVRATVSYRFPSGWGPQLTDTPPMDADSVDWTGFHLGAEAGYGGVAHNFGFEAHDYTLGGLLQVGGFPGTIEGIDLFAIGASIDVGGRGPIESLSAGYDLQLGDHFVLGLLGDYTFGQVTGTASAFASVCFDIPAVCDTPQDPLMPDPDFRVDGHLTVGNIWTVGARAGYLAGDRTLIYLLAAYSNVNLDVSVDLTTPGGTSEIFNYPFRRNAFTFGTGIEAMLTSHVTAKFEYRGTVWSNSQTLFGDDVVGASVHSSGYEQTIRAGLTWRFGG